MTTQLHAVHGGQARGPFLCGARASATTVMRIDTPRRPRGSKRDTLDLQSDRVAPHLPLGFSTHVVEGQQESWVRAASRRSELKWPC